LCAFVLEIAALGAARGAVAQPTGSIKQGAAVAKLPAVQAVQAAEYYVVGAPITLDQALKQPDTTKIMGPDCKLTTVGELRKLHALAKKVVEAPKKFSGGTGKVSYGPGSAKGRDAAALLSSINSEAQGSRTVPGNVKFNPINRTPGIGLVNGHGSGFKITPGGYLTIAGFEFGDTMGQVNLIGNFPGGALALRIVDWKDASVYAMLPPGLRGVLDQPVTLQLITAAQKTYRHAGGTFTAAREDTTVTTNIPGLLKFQSGPSWGATMDASGLVSRYDGGESINCKATGADTLTIIDSGKGFVVTGLNARWGETDSGDGDGAGNGGSRTYSPGYGFGDFSGNSIAVKWGVWRSHSTNDGILGAPSSDQCVSYYQITVNLNGPAGVSPF
jgi:hypothetical protein